MPCYAPCYPPGVTTPPPKGGGGCCYPLYIKSLWLVLRQMKRYMVYSFCTLWTLVLIVAIIATIIHQTRFQDSPSQLKLKSEVIILERQNSDLQLKIKLLENDFFTYRQMWNGPMWE